MNVFIFNPDNDLALANNDSNYRSPASARKMGQDLTPLMGWLAKDGDALLFPESVPALPASSSLYPRLNAYSMPLLTEEFAKDRKRWTNLNYLRTKRKVVAGENSGDAGRGFFHADKKNGGEDMANEREREALEKFRNPVTAALYDKTLLQPERIIPWGWNPGLIRQLENAGVDPSLLLSAAAMAEVRAVSHRSLSVKVLQELRRNVPGEVGKLLCGSSEEVSSETELRRRIETYACNLLLKAPLSGSGRGLIRAGHEWVRPVSGWCKSTLQTQGSVIVEPLYNKVCDFAMEFYAGQDGHIAFKGYSLFETNVHGSYTRNLLMTDRRISAEICAYGFTDGQLVEVRTQLIRSLQNALAGRYRGYLGVDMMICREGENYRLHPCVEVNARFTMGVFSRLFYDSYIKEGATGTFQIRFSRDSEALRETTVQNQTQYPLAIENGRIVSGYLPLTPVDATTRFVAEVLVK